MFKKNLPYIISYFLLVLLFFVGTLFYRQSFLAILLLLECLLPVLSLTLVRLISHKLTFEVRAKAGEITCGNTIPVVFTVQNPTFLPLLNLEVTFTACNPFYSDTITQQILTVSANPHKATAYTLPFSTALSGMFCFTVHEVRITDFLHLKTFILPFTKTIEVPVLPKTVPLPQLRLPKANEAAEDSDIEQKYGVVSTEFQGVRDYIPGDKLQNIHWKMSAKADDLLVKNPSPVAERLLTVIPELEQRNLEATLRLYYSFGLFLVKNNEFFLTGIFSYTDKTFEFHEIRNKEQLTESMLHLYYARSYKGSALARTYYGSQHPSDEYLSIYGQEINYYQGTEQM